MPRLLWRDAQGIEGSIDLSNVEIRVGRAMDCAIRTDDAMVSRHHSRVYWSGGGYILEDLQSANGVFFQEQKVQQHLFKHGDAVRCGSLWLRYVDQNQLGATGGAGPDQGGPAPMMQAPGLGAVAPVAATGHVAVIGNNAQTPAGGVVPPSTPTPIAQQNALAALGLQQHSESDVEIRVLRRRVEQLQTELRVSASRSSTRTPPGGWRTWKTISR